MGRLCEVSCNSSDPIIFDLLRKGNPLSRLKLALELIMKKTYLFLVLFITGFLVSGNAYGGDDNLTREEIESLIKKQSKYEIKDGIYYCAESIRNELVFDERMGEGKTTRYPPRKFKMKYKSGPESFELVPENKTRLYYIQCKNFGDNPFYLYEIECPKFN